MVAGRAESKKKAKKNLSLISFEDDEGENADEAAAATRIRSAHDSVQDRRYSPLMIVFLVIGEHSYMTQSILKLV